MTLSRQLAGSPYGDGPKEVLVQLKDELVADLDRIAAERGISRSALLRRISPAKRRELDRALRFSLVIR